MKNVIFFFALALSAFVSSCQKETLSSVEQWLLLEQNWSVTVNRGTTTTFEAVTPAGTSVTGTEITLAQVPATVIQRLQNDGVNINNITETWQINGGGYIVKVQSAGVVYVYWFSSATQLRSIGKVSA